ncbi:MAG: hypothetical protein IIA35_08285 [Proteobacteria bacterium]|nr:hypothetical protein [Pseudomonadota bacterium]
MAEISAVTVARATALRNDTRNLRQQELRKTERLQQERQDDLDKQARIIEDQLSNDRRRLETRRVQRSDEDFESIGVGDRRRAQAKREPGRVAGGAPPLDRTPSRPQHKAIPPGRRTSARRT